MGATNHHYLGVDWHLRDVLAWFGAIVVPTSVYLSSSDFVDGNLSEEAQRDLSSLVACPVPTQTDHTLARRVPGPPPARVAAY